jgi:hypothetical protein
MSAGKRSLPETILARLTFGQVPVDGSFWFDAPRSQRPMAETRNVEKTRDIQCDEPKSWPVPGVCR